MKLDAMLRQALTDGVSDADNLPFLFDPPPHIQSRTGVLLVHGFTATPWEMRWLGAGLARNGVHSLGVRLPGHGTTAEDLAKHSREEWLATVRQGYAILAEGCDNVFGLGMSTGGLLLLALATESPLAGLVLLSPFVKLKHPLVRFAGPIAWVYPFEERPLAAGAERHYYRRRPLLGVRELVRLLDAIGPHLPTIRQPALVVGARGDQTVPAGSAQALYERLGSRSKVFHLLGVEVPHVLTTEENPYRDTVLELARSFIGDRFPAACPPAIPGKGP
ncbi:MAG: hypothetical protein A2005_06815 [Desulfuromonadales bacterium GWC2_61_20]|nr:MAG: hypothetical protein A2005_06815 [Desulfuromonadales bacterium GWC2_61_20]HAD03684.1 hypothetical protein [Desulfuromonas sp.]HBT82927.1 hypothetical protein [Desulfuromonas sp.]